ncbi:MAG TPA: DegT/DnrJ/EryC1/StrS family aminotransferase [Thermoanaerobaculia bacterium]|jgi:dTDP-4-amino-4,6-dideoxygalactose transaminase
MTTLSTAPTRTKPFAPNCSIGGRERELLLDAFESLSWSGFRAGAQAHDVRALCELPSADALHFADGEALFLGGVWTRRLEAMFAARMGVRYAVACNSATSGLVMAYGALDLGPGDEVLVPCMSFHATATALVPWGCVPVFVEVKPDTFCIDPTDAARKITPRTKAVVAVHLGGSPADMDALRALGLPIIEDCAQSLGATYHGREVGAIGTVGVCSLTETKSITCGEGGVVLTDDPRIARKARLIRNHGEGVAQEDWTDEELKNVVGMNFRLTDLQSALAVAQYEQLDERNRAREENAEHLWSQIARWQCFTRQAVEPGAVPAWFVFKTRYVPRPGMPSRDELVRLLAAEGIPAVAGYTRLLYENPLFTRRGAGYGRGTCPRAEQLNDEFLWFTFINPPNAPRDMDDVADALEKIFAHAAD